VTCMVHHVWDVVETGKNVFTCFFIVALHVYVELIYVHVFNM